MRQMIISCNALSHRRRIAVVALISQCTQIEMSYLECDIIMLRFYACQIYLSLDTS